MLADGVLYNFKLLLKEQCSTLGSNFFLALEEKMNSTLMFVSQTHSQSQEPVSLA